MVSMVSEASNSYWLSFESWNYMIVMHEKAQDLCSAIEAEYDTLMPDSLEIVISLLPLAFRNDYIRMLDDDTRMVLKTICLKLLQHPNQGSYVLEKVVKLLSFHPENVTRGQLKMLQFALENIDVSTQNTDCLVSIVLAKSVTTGKEYDFLKVARLDAVQTALNLLFEHQIPPGLQYKAGPVASRECLAKIGVHYGTVDCSQSLTFMLDIPMSVEMLLEIYYPEFEFEDGDMASFKAVKDELRLPLEIVGVVETMVRLPRIIFNTANCGA